MHLLNKTISEMTELEMIGLTTFLIVSGVAVCVCVVMVMGW